MGNRILFFLTNDYTHYCLAHAMQKKDKSELFAISEVTSRPKKFFETQKLVNFEKIWFFHEQIKNSKFQIDFEYLANFEKKYKINLWKLLQNERIFLYFKNFHKFTYHEILNIVEQECRFFEKILGEVKPDYFFTRLPSLHHQELIYDMCKNTNVKVVAMNYTLLGKKSMISQEQGRLDYVTDLEQLDHQNRDFNDLQQYIKSFDLLQQIDDKLVKQTGGGREKISSLKEYLFNFDFENTKTHYTYYGRNRRKVLSYYLKDVIKRKTRKKFVDKKLKMKIGDQTRFVYFPLHIEMERSLLLGAPYYVNQTEVIRNVAKSLPIDYKLYVKEHPGNVLRSWRSKEEYEQIMEIPNVVLFHPDFSKEELYKKCTMVFSIAGTAGFEASCYGKPAITLVDVNYSILPSVKVLRNFDELPGLFNELSNLKVNPTHVDQFLTLFENNISNFDWSDFSKKMHDKFFAGSIQDAIISEKDMKEFLEENNDMIENFADEHIKKMNWFANGNNR